jgi:cellulose synthase/poly-beta-1,6-N-acetylglucosamine synthase-like glycosyltransferase
MLPAMATFVRLLLIWFSVRTGFSRSRPAEAGPHTEKIRRWLVVVPSRHEGVHVARTLASIREASKKHSVFVLLLLDGSDQEAEELAKTYGANVVHKEPSGPTKAAALAWLARTSADELQRHDAILVLDVGSTLSPSFFDHFEWDRGCDGMQAMISGTGGGVGDAAAASERFAQSREDRGRQIVGWSARLRGTGSALRPDVFIAIMKQLRTRMEDLEASVLLMARGSRVALGDPQAMVRDEKPQSIYSAASQRARWILGQYEVLIRQRSAFRKALSRSPAEAASTFFEIFGRPLSLSVPLRIGIAAVALLTPGRGPLVLFVAFVVLATALADILMTIILEPSAARYGPRLVIAWLLAMLMTPRALFRWMRAKRL